jgi:hypothetical protein
MTAKICKECGVSFIPNRREQTFCDRSCASKPKGRRRKGQKTGPRRGWIYAKRTNRDGYLMIYAGNHPYAEGRKMIPVHVAAVELEMGRRINPGECVHHRDGNVLNNRMKNLELMSHADHSRMHATETAKTRKRIGGRFA